MWIYSNMFIPLNYIRVNKKKILLRSEQIWGSTKLPEKQGKNTSEMAIIPCEMHSFSKCSILCFTTPLGCTSCISHFWKPGLAWQHAAACSEAVLTSVGVGCIGLVSVDCRFWLAVDVDVVGSCKLCRSTFFFISTDVDVRIFWCTVFVTIRMSWLRYQAVPCMNL